MEYNFKKIEKKWQVKWREEGAFEVEKPDYFVLSMWPYPSGNLHMGHLRNYCIGDVIARFKKLKGYKVLHPMGFDAFGLPAENAAIERGVHPKEWTLANIKNMREELVSLGLSFDFTRQEISCLPEYYKHEQKMFLDFLKSGIAYKKESIVNWDPVDNTVLANEQVVDGKGWRSGALVEKKMLSQWFLKISEFSNELLEGVKLLENWPEKVKLMQENWIGRSVGAEINFEVIESKTAITVFTTRPDTLFGASFLAISYGHPFALSLNSNEVKDFVKECEKGSTKAEDIETAEKKGVFTGFYAKNPVNGESLPIYIANFVLMEYGTGALFGAPAHDLRDFEFAVKYNLPIKPVVSKYKDVIIETERCYLRPFTEDDFENLYKLHSNSEVTKYMGGVQTKEETLSSLQMYIRWQKEYGFSRWAVFEKETGRFMGRCGPGPFDCYAGKRFGLKNDVEIGYAYLQEFWGKGFASEVLTAVLAWVFRTYPNLRRIIAATNPPHIASQTILKKVGFEYIGEDITTEKYGLESFFVLNKSNVTLNTKRFILRPFKDEYLENLVKLNLEITNNPLITSSEYKKTGEELEELSKRKIKLYQEMQEKYGFSRFAVFERASGEFVGSVGFVNLEPRAGMEILENSVELVYSILEKFQRKGYGTELLEEVLKHANGYNVYALIDEKNLPSKNFAMKCGFKKVGEVKTRKYEKEEIYLLPVTVKPFTDNGFNINSGFLNGLSTFEAKETMCDWLMSRKKGVRKVNYRLKDWGVSRQRYWGAPIPVINCKKCGVVPVPEQSLPVTLPEDIIVEVGENPLKKHPTWRFVKCPSCAGDAERETDTFDTFFESSWYFLRFGSNFKTKEEATQNAFINPLKVNDYIGGVEHAILHLLYARFFVKALKKSGYKIEFDEPFERLITQGMVCHKTFKKDGVWITPAEAAKYNQKELEVGASIKMSKSKKNTIEPATIVEEYGADTARFFMMSDTPPERDFEWSSEGVSSSFKYITKLWQFAVNLTKRPFLEVKDEEVLKFVNKILFEYEQEIERVALNKAIAKIREFSNFIFLAKPEDCKFLFQQLLIMLVPFTPHIAFELASLLELSLNFEFPRINKELLVSNAKNISVQVNGKLRGVISIATSAGEAEVKAEILKQESILKYIHGKQIVKEMYIKDKIYSFVVK